MRKEFKIEEMFETLKANDKEDKNLSEVKELKH